MFTPADVFTPAEVFTPSAAAAAGHPEEKKQKIKQEQDPTAGSTLGKHGKEEKQLLRVNPSLERVEIKSRTGTYLAESGASRIHAALRQAAVLSPEPCLSPSLFHPGGKSLQAASSTA